MLNPTPLEAQTDALSILGTWLEEAVHTNAAGRLLEPLGDEGWYRRVGHHSASSGSKTSTKIRPATRTSRHAAARA